MIRQYRAFEDLVEPCYLVPEPEWITVTYQMKSIIWQWRWCEIKELIPKNLTKNKNKKLNMQNDNDSSNKNLTHSQTQIKSHFQISNSAPASPNLRVHNLNNQLASSSSTTTTTNKTKTKTSTHHHPKDPEKILKKNLLKISFVQIATNKTASMASKEELQFIKEKWYRFDSREILDEFLSDASRQGYIERLVTYRWFTTRVKYVPRKKSQNKQLESAKENQNDDNQIKKKRTWSTSSSISSTKSLDNQKNVNLILNDKINNRNIKQTKSKNQSNIQKEIEGTRI